MMSTNRSCIDPVEYSSSSLGIPSGPLDRPYLRLLAAAPISSEVKGLASGRGGPTKGSKGGSSRMC